jgi:DNA-binding LacI/PurR family transcriptional regulator
MPEKVTIEAVARSAQVSRQTVSNVLNAPHLVSTATRDRVLAAIEALGFRANQAARQMRTGKSRLVGVRIDPSRNGIEGTVLDRFLHGLTEAAAPAGYRVVLYTAADDSAEIATYADLLAAYALDGFILTHTHHGDARTAWLHEHRVPFVTFGRPWGGLDLHDWVDVDGAAGTAAATRALLDDGHRRIGYIGWPEGSGVGDDRRSGWARELATAGFDGAGLVRLTPDGTGNGEAAARELLALPDPPTAFVCASDPLALGALRATDADRVIGFDDTVMAEATGLSSVRQPVADAAATCVSLLVDRLDGNPDRMPARHVLLRPHLVVRRSRAKPPTP